MLALVKVLTSEWKAAATAARWEDACAACARADAALALGPLPGHSVARAMLRCRAAEHAARGAEEAPGGARAAAALREAAGRLLDCEVALSTIEQRGALVPLQNKTDADFCMVMLASESVCPAGDTMRISGREGEFAGYVCSLRVATLSLRLAAVLHGAGAAAPCDDRPPLDALATPALRALRCVHPAHKPCCTVAGAGIAYSMQTYVCIGALPRAEAAFTAQLDAALPLLPSTPGVASLRGSWGGEPASMEKRLLLDVPRRLAHGVEILADSSNIRQVCRKDGSAAKTVTDRARERGLRACSAPSCSGREIWPGEFRVCGRCRSAAYCGKEHQVAHWRSGHKQECAALAAAAPAAEGAAEEAKAEG